MGIVLAICLKEWLQFCICNFLILFPLFDIFWRSGFISHTYLLCFKNLLRIIAFVYVCLCVCLIRHVHAFSVKFTLYFQKLPSTETIWKTFTNLQIYNFHAKITYLIVYNIYAYNFNYLAKRIERETIPGKNCCYLFDYTLKCNTFAKSIIIT